MVMMDVVDQDAAKGFRARLIPLGNRASTDQVDAGLAMTVAVWLRKHGKVNHCNEILGRESGFINALVPSS